MFQSLKNMLPLHLGVPISIPPCSLGVPAHLVALGVLRLLSIQILFGHLSSEALKVTPNLVYTVPRIRGADITCYILHTVSIAVPHPFNAIQISPFGSSTLIYSHLLSSFVHSLFPLEIQDPRVKSLI